MKKLLFCIIAFPLTSYATQPRAIVVGASSGIGRAVAKELCAHGYIVGLAARREEKLFELRDELKTTSYTKYIDVNDTDQAQSGLLELIDELGGLDLLVVNAGVMRGDFDDTGTLDWQAEQAVIATNVQGFSAIASWGINYFREQGHGHVVGISSVAAMRGTAGCPTYWPSKAFVSTYLEGMRNTFIQENIPITVTDVRPGFVATSHLPHWAYWVVTPHEAAGQIYDAIATKKKVAYVTKRWQLIGWLLRITPDWVYNRMGGF